MQELRGRGDVSQPVDKDVTMAFPVWYISINCHLSQAGVGKPELLCQHMHRAPLGSHRQGSWQRWWFMRQFSGFFLERESGKKNPALLSIPIVTSGWVIGNGGGGGRKGKLGMLTLSTYRLESQGIRSSPYTGSNLRLLVLPMSSIAM